jgi:PAS domain S-box-containing protein
MSSDKVVGKYVHEVIQEPLFSRARQKYIQAIAEKKTVQWEEVVEYPTGKRYGDCNITAVFDENGQPTNIIGSIHDSTGYRRIEEALRESENLYRTLAESSTDLIFVIGRDDRVEYVNSYASAMVNKPVDQIIGGPRASLFPPDVARNQKKALEKVFETGAPFRNESPITFAGRVYWFDHYLTPLKDADNNIRSVLGISRDITERKNTEKKLRENEQSYQRLLEQSFDAIAIHKDRKIAYLNKRAAEILGAASPEDLIDRPIFDLIHTESRRGLEDRLQKLNTDPGFLCPSQQRDFSG